MNAAIYARISTHEQQTLPIQLKAMEKYAMQREWNVVIKVADVGSGASERPKRDSLLFAARRREIDTIIVWKLDRWGRSLSDLISTLEELNCLGVGFISITEALDFTTPAGKALTGMLAVFSEFERDLLRERIKAGIAKAKEDGKFTGRPLSASLKTEEVLKLFAEGKSKSSIAKTLNIGRSSVGRIIKKMKDESNQNFASLTH